MNCVKDRYFNLTEVDVNIYLVSFTQDVVDELGDLSYIEIVNPEIIAEMPFVEVETDKATFEYSLPFNGIVLEDYTEEILKENDLSDKTIIAKIKKIFKI